MQGCNAKAQKKLSNHLTYKHPDLDSSQRKHFLKVAKKAFNIPKATGQKVLQFTTSHSKASSSLESPTSTMQSSRGMDKFPLSNPSIALFMEHLRRLDGGRRNEATVKAIATDISKLMRSMGSVLDWDNILQPIRVKFDEVNVQFHLHRPFYRLRDFSSYWRRGGLVQKANSRSWTMCVWSSNGLSPG